MAKSHAWSQPSIASFQSLVTKTNVERPTEIATKGGFDKGPEEHFKGEKKSIWRGLWILDYKQPLMGKTFILVIKNNPYILDDNSLFN